MRYRSAIFGFAIVVLVHLKVHRDGIFYISVVVFSADAIFHGFFTSRSSRRENSLKVLGIEKFFLYTRCASTSPATAGGRHDAEYVHKLTFKKKTRNIHDERRRQMKTKTK